MKLYTCKLPVHLHSSFYNNSAYILGIFLVVFIRTDEVYDNQSFNFCDLYYYLKPSSFYKNKDV